MGSISYFSFFHFSIFPIPLHILFRAVLNVSFTRWRSSVVQSILKDEMLKLDTTIHALRLEMHNRYEKAREDKTRQDKTRQGKARQEDKARQDKTRQDKTRQDKDRTRQDKRQQTSARTFSPGSYPFCQPHLLILSELILSGLLSYLDVLSYLVPRTFKYRDRLCRRLFWIRTNVKI